MKCYNKILVKNNLFVSLTNCRNGKNHFWGCTKNWHQLPFNFSLPKYSTHHDQSLDILQPIFKKKKFCDVYIIRLASNNEQVLQDLFSAIMSGTYDLQAG